MSDQQAVDRATVDVEELVARLEAHSNRFDNLEQELADAREERDDLREEVTELREENRELREEIERLDARTDLLQLVDDSDDLDGEQRSTALIQHLRRAAERQRERGRDAKASVTREEAEEALHYPDVDRTTIYSDMERAERLVGNKDVLRYESSTGGASRLKLNLEAGDLPAGVGSGTSGNGGV